MPEPNLTSGDRAKLYEALFQINSSFDSVVKRLRDLENTQKLNSERLGELRGFAQEVQLHINNRVLEELQNLEGSDWYHFGKFRAAMEDRSKQ